MEIDAGYLLRKLEKVQMKWDLVNEMPNPSLEKISEKAQLFGQVKLLDEIMNDVTEVDSEK